MLAEIAVGEACRKQLEQQEGAPEGLHLGIGKAESRGSLGCHPDGAIDFLKGFFSEDAVVADALHLEQLSVGFTADVAKRGQVAQVLADVKIVSIVNGGLST